MQNRAHLSDPRIPQIRAAVKQRMRDRKHVQKDVEIATGVHQSHISRFLSGHGKRMTARIEALCKYAGFEIAPHNEHEAAQRELSQALQRAIGDNPGATLALARIVQALTPILRYLPNEPSSKDLRP